MVRQTLSPKRFQHTMNVKNLAVRMAQHYGVDTEKAALAAILHDSAKELPRTELLQIMQDNAIIKKGTQNRPEPVWHGICAAILAKTQWNVQDEEILSAIACHTTGKENMSKLDKILFLADMTSAERDYPGVEELRSLEMRNLDKAIALGSEYLYKTCLTGPKAEEAFARVLSQQKLNMEQQFIQQGNVYAATRAGAHYTVDGAVSERCSGVSYYKFLCGVQERGNWAALGEKLDALRTEVLQHAQLTVSLHGSEDALARLRTLLPESRFAAAQRTPAQPYTQPLTPPVNEAFIIDGGVNYDVLVWPMERRSDRKVLARVMSYEYLWHSIREVGGAYGTGMLSSDGVEYLYTYRDPHVKESYDTFAKGPAELAAREYTEKDLNDFIVGAAAKLDTPRKPRAEARETDRRYFCGITDEMVSADRRALCAVDAALLKEQAAELGAAMANGVRVVFGSKDAVEAAKDLFDTVETL